MLISTGCPPGTKRLVDEDGYFIGCKRIDCQPDTPANEIGKSCAPCEKGERLIKSGKCVKCPRNAVSNGGVSDKCTTCPEGMLRNPFKKSECACIGQKLLGHGLIDGECRKCGIGMFAPVIGGRLSGVCIPCPTGQFTDVIGSYYCDRCPLGTFSDVEGASSCKSCPSGFVPDLPVGATHCVRAG